jgi:hypothetical protein
LFHGPSVCVARKRREEATAKLAAGSVAREVDVEVEAQRATKTDAAGVIAKRGRD